MMRHGLPAWMTGNESAVMREKTVNSSATRVTGRRHSACVSRRMAEIMIPAWLMPTQKTKVVIRVPQKTGRFRPVTPRPLLIMKPKVENPARTMISSPSTAHFHQRGVASVPFRSWTLICCSLSSRCCCIFP